MKTANTVSVFRHNAMSWQWGAACVLLTASLCFSCSSPSSERHSDGGREKTAFQTSAAWRPELDVRSDVAIVYSVNSHGNEGGKDVFEVASDGRKIILSGNNGVSVASAYNWYLKSNRISSGQKNYAEVVGMILSLPEEWWY